MRTNIIHQVFRNLYKNNVSSIINLIGLSAGIAVVLVISIYLHVELSTDSFHENLDNIYRFEATNFNGTVDMPGPLAELVRDRIPEIEQILRIDFTHTWGLPLKYNNEHHITKGLLFADSTFFKLFSFQSVLGNLTTALNEPNSIVITKSLATKIFGDDAPLGKKILLKNKEYLTVNGVVNDVPNNSSIDYSGIISFPTLKSIMPDPDYLKDWGNFNYETYCIIRNKNLSFIESKINNEFHQLLPEREKTTFALHPFKGLYFKNNQNDDNIEHGNIQSLIFLSISGILIIVLAIVNFINLSLAATSHRLKAVSVRKVIGAQNKHVYWLFLSETFAIIFISGLFGVLIAKGMLPIMNTTTSSTLSFSLIANYPMMLLILSSLVLLSIVSAYIPYQAVKRQEIPLALKNQFNFNKPKSRHILVSFQFLITIVLITVTLFINKQIRYINTKDLGFETDKTTILLFLEDNLTKNYNLLKEQLSQYSQFSNICLSHSTPGTMGMQWGGELSFKGEKKKVSYYSVPVTPGYLEIMGYRIKSGRFFNDSIASDKGCFILNETAAKKYGISEAPLEAEFVNFGGEVGKIIGIVEDFNFESLHEKIKPLAFNYIPQFGEMCSLVSIKTNSNNILANFEIVKSEYQQLFPDKPFECFLMDDIFSNYYIKEKNLNKIISSFSILSILIGCLGLIGIVNILIVSKTKEIGIRKVNGATVSEILTMLNKDFIKWVAIAFVIACPIAWYAMTRWLENFAYKTTLSWWIFALAGVLALGIALLTVSWQSWRAATRNPVEALRYE